MRVGDGVFVVGMMVKRGWDMVVVVDMRKILGFGIIIEGLRSRLNPFTVEACDFSVLDVPTLPLFLVSDLLSNFPEYRVVPVEKSFTPCTLNKEE